MGATTAPVPSGTWFSPAKLLEMRAEAGLDRRAAAARLGVSYSYLEALERGERLPSVAMVVRLAAGYGRHPGELFCAQGGPR